MPDHAPQLERKPAWPIALNTLSAALVAGGIAAWAGFVAVPPTGWYADQPFTPSLAWLGELFSSAGTDAITAEPVFRLLQHPMSVIWRSLDTIDSFDLVVPLTFRLAVIGSIALITAIIVGLYAYRGSEKVDRLKHIRGRRLLKGANAIRQARSAQRKSIRKSGRGIDVAPRIPISLERRAINLQHSLLP